MDDLLIYYMIGDYVVSQTDPGNNDLVCKLFIGFTTMDYLKKNTKNNKKFILNG